MTAFVIAMLVILTLSLARNISILHSGEVKPRTMGAVKNATILGVVFVVWGFVVLLG